MNKYSIDSFSDIYTMTGYQYLQQTMIQSESINNSWNMLLRVALIIAEIHNMHHRLPDHHPNQSAISVAASQQRVHDLIESLPPDMRSRVAYAKSESKKYLNNDTIES